MSTTTHDTTRIDDIRMSAVRPLVTPALLQEMLPASQALMDSVEQHRQAISKVLHGEDDRLVVVVGPCSIHSHEQAMEYARWLKPLADEPTKDEGERADIPMMCNLSDTGMDAIILRARKAMELSSIEVPSIH